MTPVRLALLALLLLGGAAGARAEGTGGCHCYQDRAFDPARPAAALLQLRQERGGWREALQGLPGLTGPVSAALASSAPAADLAALAVDDVLAARMGASQAALKALHGAGAAPEERILATALSSHLGTPTAPLVAAVHAGKTSWGAVLHDAGLSPMELDGLIRRLVR